MACSTVHLFVLPSSPQDSNPLFSSSTRRFISGLSACSLHRRTCILYIPPDTNDMETFELEYCRGRWLAPLEVIDELYDALLRLPAKGQTDYITLGSRDSDVEICCATKPKKFAKEPFAYTEAEAHTKLSAWRHSGLNLNIQIQKLVFRFNSIQIPIIQYSGFIQYVIPWQVLADVKVSEGTSLSTAYPFRTYSLADASRSPS